MPKDSPEHIVIKKYANRRLYDTHSKCFVNASQLAEMIRDGKDITVIDKVSGEDITTLILTQVIMEEGREQNTLNVPLLHKMIRSSGSTYKRLVEDLLTTGTKTLQQARGKVESTLKPRPKKEKAKPKEPVDELDAIKARLAELEELLSKKKS